jgi:predicted Zn-dependent protease
MNKIEGVKYYDGKSSLGFQADLELSIDVILITYTDIYEIRKNVIWDVKNIHKSDFNSPENTVLKYGEFPYQVLEITNKETHELLFNFYNDFGFTKSTYNSLKTKPIKMILGGGIVLISLLTLIYYFALPTVAEHAAASLPYSIEEELGTSTVNQVLSMSSIDSVKSKNINLFFKELNYKPTHKVSIHVIKSDMVNAFAVPGGHIFVYSGIIDKMKSKDELSALLAHEYSHLKFRHSLKSVCRNLSSYLFLSVLLSDVNGIVAILAQNADMLINMDFSRSMEKEADTEGLKLMLQSRVNPNGMINLFHRLADETPKITENKVFEMVSSHPQTKERIKYITQEINKTKYSLVVNNKLEQYWQGIK